MVTELLEVFRLAIAKLLRKKTVSFNLAISILRWEVLMQSELQHSKHQYLLGFLLKFFFKDFGFSFCWDIDFDTFPFIAPSTASDTEPYLFDGESFDEAPSVDTKTTPNPYSGIDVAHRLLYIGNLWIASLG